MYKLIRPLLFSMDPEDAHNRAISIGRYFQHGILGTVFENVYGFDDQRLEQEIHGISFDNPVGLAAGFDKNAELVELMSRLGFGFTEVGSVTYESRDGNDRPRVFRLPNDRAIINRMGLNGDGAYVVRDRLYAQRSIPVGVNIAKTHDPEIMGDKAIADFCGSFKLLNPQADYTVLNISCPNTTEGKTFEDVGALDELLYAILEVRCGESPLLLKLSPDVTPDDLDGILGISSEHGVDGYVVSNTSSGRDGLCYTEPDIVEQIGVGGLSGSPVRSASTVLIDRVYSLLNNPFIIGVGGVMSPEDAYSKIRYGASLVQVYTGLVYEGPGLVKKINKGLVRLMERDGFENISEVIGVLHV